ncbi:trypsin-like serine peptidase [Actinoplanes sp. CA-051413]|uniref:trypsin-like serine peptidase n=1 Tax=Actinoplanes sp. CA-051413 TaxID=3239899 RepID=UPI003D971090
MTRLAVPLAVLLVLGVGAGPAGAAAVSPSSEPVESAALINGRVVRDAATAQRLIDAYWTPERMRTAIAVPDPRVIEDPALEQRDRPGNVGRPQTAVRPAGPSAAGGTRSTGRAVNPSAGVGKVFFTKSDGKNYVCSGSTLNNETRNLVSTAAHCIHGGKGGVNHENWMYAPLYAAGKTPYGKFAAKWFHATKGWTQHSYHWWDFAFVNVWPLAGVRLVDKTGGNGISFNQSKSIPVTVLAYPSKAPYDGQKQVSCVTSLQWAAAAQVKVFCGLTPGASGGPMFQNFDPTIGFGFTNTVVAYVWKSRNYGPYFDSDVLTVFNRARNKT